MIREVVFGLLDSLNLGVEVAEVVAGPFGLSHEAFDVVLRPSDRNMDQNWVRITWRVYYHPTQLVVFYPPNYSVEFDLYEETSLEALGDFLREQVNSWRWWKPPWAS